MTGDDIKAAAQMFEDHTAQCDTCKDGLDCCPVGGKLLQLFYQTMIDESARNGMTKDNPAKKKPPDSVH